MRRFIVFLVAGQLAGCAVLSFTPTLQPYEDYLSPATGEHITGSYSVDAGKVIFALEGLRVEVEPMTDKALEGVFPDDSAKGRFSTNPYTYGDWIDPVLGYTPVRFSVFRVTVVNDIYAKVLFDPLKAVLHTDRGEALHSYGIPSYSPHNSFERYYRSLRGQSGNEFYRFDLRMGNVRSSAYLEDQLVFKGESYSGLIAFDPLKVDVTQVRLFLEEFVTKFDASGQPLESVDVSMDFDRILDRGQLAAAGE
ncbi:MAG TPA: hypothetical protein QGF95_16735 [Candidatus Latescibacteria bacterium]|nr:hypothetical protein [Candidatus Latescibacterota bacterium]